MAATCRTLHLVAARTCRWAACLGHPCKCGVQVTPSRAPMSLPGVGQQLPPKRGAPGGPDPAAAPAPARRAHAAGVRRAGGSAEGEDVVSSPPWELDVCWGRPPAPQGQGSPGAPIPGVTGLQVSPSSVVSCRSGWWWRTRTGWSWCHTGPPGPTRPCCCPAATSAASRTSVRARGTVSGSAPR